MLAHEELRFEIQIHNRVEALRGDVGGLLEGFHPAVRAHDVDVAVDGEAFFEETRDFRHGGDVGLDGVRARAVGLDRRDDAGGGGEAFVVVYDDGAAAGTEFEGDAGADAAGGAGYEGDFAGEGGEGEGGGGSGGVAVCGGGGGVGAGGAVGDGGGRWCVGHGGCCRGCCCCC